MVANLNTFWKKGKCPVMPLLCPSILLLCLLTPISFMPHASSCTFLYFPKSPPKPPLCPSMPSPMPQCVLLFPHNPPLCQLLWPLCTFQCPMPICHCMPSLWPTAPLPILRSLCPMALCLLLWPLLCPYVPMPCNMTPV